MGSRHVSVTPGVGDCVPLAAVRGSHVVHDSVYTARGSRSVSGMYSEWMFAKDYHQAAFFWQC